MASPKMARAYRQKQKEDLILREIYDAQAIGKIKWIRPMDLGGRDGSFHSPTLGRLCAQGLVERRARNTLMNMVSAPRAVSYVYQITKAGRLAARRLIAASQASGKPEQPLEAPATRSHRPRQPLQT